MTDSSLVVPQHSGPPFLMLEIHDVRATASDVGVDDDGYQEVVRYLDSAPVVLELGVPEVVNGGGLRREYRSDGTSLWDNLDHERIIRNEVYFGVELVQRARARDGVCGVLREETVRDAAMQILGDTVGSKSTVVI